MPKNHAFLLAAVLLGPFGFADSAGANPIEILSVAEAEHCGRFTIAPGGGENLVDPAYGNDYRIHLTLWETGDIPIAGLPATDMWLWHSGLVICPGIFNQADGPTDANGHTTFSGTIYAGLTGDATDGLDCSGAYLYVYAMGMPMNEEEPVCVSTDSPDLNGDLMVGVTDFAKFAQDFNCASQGQACDPCHDFNQDGNTALADLAILAGYLNNSACR